jgi:Transglycosylase SLT domain
MHNGRMIPLSLSRAVGLTPRRRTTRRRRKRKGSRRGRVLRAWRRLQAAPRSVRLPLIAATVLALVAAGNLLYQVVRKPTEMLFPVAGVLDKRPAETWEEYAPLFVKHATAAIAPELLAALAQAESAGNPVARTYWRWRFTWDLFAIYAPASSAVGMYQMTDAAFVEAQQGCVHDHVVVAAEECWFTGLYTRVLPTHAIELAVVYLDRKAARILAQLPRAKPTARQRQDLAALIHLCGPTPAKVFARRGFRLLPGQRCGDHDVAQYLATIAALTTQFRRLAAQ